MTKDCVDMLFIPYMYAAQNKIYINQVVCYLVGTFYCNTLRKNLNRVGYENS